MPGFVASNQNKEQNPLFTGNNFKLICSKINQIDFNFQNISCYYLNKAILASSNTELKSDFSAP